MRPNSPSRRSSLCSLTLLAILFTTASADAQVISVVVGVTPTCPYGIAACWAGAYEGLGRMQGVTSVATNPDTYNCVGQVHVKDGGLPDIGKWAEEFKAVVGEVYIFRGVEATMEGSVEQKEGQLVLRVPGIAQPVTLAKLDHKLQWNFKKGAARQPEPDEREAYQQLTGLVKTGTAIKARVTGPLRVSGNEMVLEVREFFP